MPLYEKVRVEIFIPDYPTRKYQKLKNAISTEMTETFGGCSIINSIDGYYMNSSKLVDHDPIALIFSDTNMKFDKKKLSEYIDLMAEYVKEALGEEAVLGSVYTVINNLKP